MSLAVFSAVAGAAPLTPAPAAASHATPVEEPAVNTNKKVAGEFDDGTTIVGEQDAAVGLYLTPWKNERLADIDRPPNLLDEPPPPLDRRGLQRQVRTYDSINAYRHSQTPQ